MELPSYITSPGVASPHSPHIRSNTEFDPEGIEPSRFENETREQEEDSDSDSDLPDLVSVWDIVPESEKQTLEEALEKERAAATFEKQQSAIETSTQELNKTLFTRIQNMTSNNVYLFIPNLIGYARIVLMGIAFMYAMTDYTIFFACYALSMILDQFDGQAARAFNQTSKYGAVLDMVTDRASTASLMLVLVHFYPQHILLLVFLNALDLVSHFAHMYSSLARGSSSHKTLSSEQNALLRLYYHNRYFMYVLCFGQEAFYLLVYAWNFTEGPLVEVPGFGQTPLVPWLATICLPVCAFKQLMNLIQLMQAAQDIVAMDMNERRQTKRG